MSGYWIVTVHYNPGVPKRFLVSGAEDSTQAQERVLLHIGYNPGVPISSRGPIHGPARCGAEVLRYRPLSSEEQEMIRYND